MDAAVSAIIINGWRKFRELLPLLTSKGTSLRLRGTLHAACVGSMMLCGNETWLMKKEDERRCERNIIKMVRWMCDVTLKDRKSNVELRERLGRESMSEVMCL